MQSELTPVQEVAFFIARGKVQDRIEKRKRELMDNLEACVRREKKIDTAAATASAASATMDVEADAIDLVSDDEGESTMSYPDQDKDDAVSVPQVAEFLPSARRVADQDRNVPKTLEELWQRLKAMQVRGETDAPVCPCPKCPYSRGPLMRQRYTLMELLVEREHQLYGV